MFYNQLRKNAIKRLEAAQNDYKLIAENANNKALELYVVRKSSAKEIERVEMYINMLANAPKEFVKDVAQVKLEIKDFNEAVRIEETSTQDNLKGAGAAVAGTVAGGLIASLGPTAAMAIATTFGTASTGAAISALTGAAATNAALAWLGGGAIAAGGGGMAAGNAFLALAGPVGWGIAGVLIIGGGGFASYKNKKAAEEAQKITLEIKEKISILLPKLEELSKLVDKTKELKKALDLSLIINTFPNDYEKFSDKQKMALGALINNTKAMGQLINARIS